MEQKAVPDPVLVRELAGKAIKMLEARAKQFDEARYTSKELAAILQQLADRGAREKAGSWDEAAKTYLAVVAVHLAWRETSRVQPPDLGNELRKIRGLLQSPSDKDGSQGRYTPELLLEPYGMLRKRLGS